MDRPSSCETYEEKTMNPPTSKPYNYINFALSGRAFHKAGNMELKINFNIALALFLEGVDLLLRLTIFPFKVGVNGKKL